MSSSHHGPSLASTIIHGGHEVSPGHLVFMPNNDGPPVAAVIDQILVRQDALARCFASAKKEVWLRSGEVLLKPHEVFASSREACEHQMQDLDQVILEYEKQLSRWHAQRKNLEAWLKALSPAA